MESPIPKNIKPNNGQDAIYKDEDLEVSLKNLFREQSNQIDHHYYNKWALPSFHTRRVKRSKS